MYLSRAESPLYFDLDPNLSVRVHGPDEDNSVVAKEGEDRTLECSAIGKWFLLISLVKAYIILTVFISIADMNTGLPIEHAQFTWDLRTVDDQPLITNRLAQLVLTADGKLQLFGLKSSSKNARARCLAIIPERDEIPEWELKRKPPFYFSPVVKFQVIPLTKDFKLTEPKIG